MLHRRITAVVLFAALVAPLPLAAAGEISDALRAATVRVICDDRQGSGVLTSSEHVITVGHVPLDPETGAEAAQCRVGFISGGGSVPNSYSRAEVVHAVLSSKYDLDFAVLKIGPHISGPTVSPVPVKVQLFVDQGAQVMVAGYPGSESGLSSMSGEIVEFSRGTIATTAVISQGYSGGPGVDGAHDLIGIASRIAYLIDPDTGEERDHRYLLGDMATMVTWLDARGDAPSGTYITHAEPERMAVLPYFLRDESPGCLDVVRTRVSSTVYCLLSEDRRFVFPNTSVYFSWFPDFSPVKLATLEDIARFRLVGNMTYKAGTLVKITTDPMVYMVTDTFGTLRPIPNEARARELFGDGWAGLVKDVPDAFFVDYAIGRPL